MKSGQKAYWMRNTLEVVFWCFITSVLIMGIPHIFKDVCYDDSEIQKTNCESNDESCTNLANDNQFECSSDTEYNPYAALLLGHHEQIIKYLLHYDTVNWFKPTPVFIGFVVYFILGVYTYGLAIPSGLFIPLILIGSHLGWFVGYGWEYIINNGKPTRMHMYALMGASAMLGGTTRMTISLVAIIIEITNDVYYLMPVMIVVMISKLVGDRFNAPIYESHVGLKGILYLETSLPKFVPPYCIAKDIMSKPVVVIPVICPVKYIIKVLSAKSGHNHNAFPIIDNRDIQNPHKISKNSDKYDENDGQFIGMILRWKLIVLLNHNKTNKTIGTLDEIIKIQPIDKKLFTDTRYRNVQHMNFELSYRQIRNSFIDLTHYIQISPYTANTNTPIKTVYKLFRGLGLRHLTVIDAEHYIRGIITAKELVEHNLHDKIEHLNRKLKQDGSLKKRIDYMTNMHHSNDIDDHKSEYLHNRDSIDSGIRVRRFDSNRSLGLIVSQDEMNRSLPIVNTQNDHTLGSGIHSNINANTRHHGSKDYSMVYSSHMSSLNNYNNDRITDKK